MSTPGRVALAFSGGLDTSFCIAWLREQGHEVVTITVDTGGFSPDEHARIAAVSAKLGAVEHVVEDGREELFDRYLRYLVFGNVLRGNMYPLSVSAERVCQAERVVQAARRTGCTMLCHGSTGAGNDQVRFDVAFHTLAPEMKVLAPIRDLGLSREAEAGYLAERGHVVPPKTTQYSINQGMWGTSVGGRETLDSWTTLPDAAYPGGAPEARGVVEPRTITLSFERGVPCALDGDRMAPIALTAALNRIGGEYAIGRGVHLGDTILGIKGRVGFEAPAAHLLIGAHRELEKLVLSGKQQFWKETLGNLYGSLLHEGHFYDPLARDVEAFLTSSQATVTGEVRVRLAARTFTVEGVRSPFSLMDKAVASYGEENRLWNGAEAAGYGRIHGVQQVISAVARRRGAATLATGGAGAGEGERS